MGGSIEVFTSQNEDQQFNYANVRKAAYRGSKTVILSDSETFILSVFKFCLIWGIFLTWFADSLLFDMMLKTSFKDGVDNTQNLIDKNMILCKIYLQKKKNCRQEIPTVAKERFKRF